jgi:hypothetical protein
MRLFATPSARATLYRASTSVNPLTTDAPSSCTMTSACRHDCHHGDHHRRVERGRSAYGAHLLCSLVAHSLSNTGIRGWAEFARIPAQSLKTTLSSASIIGRITEAFPKNRNFLGVCSRLLFASTTRPQYLKFYSSNIPVYVYCARPQ